MKIAIICNEYPPGPHGGIGTATQNLSRALQRRGHSVRVTGLYGREYPTPDHEYDQGVEVFRIRRSRGWFAGIRDRARLYRKIRDWVNKGAIDLIEVPDYDGMAAGWPALSVPMIGRICGAASYFQAELGQKVDPVAFRLEKRSLHRCHFWAAKSRFAAENAEKFFSLPPQKVGFIYNPMPIPNAVSSSRSRNEVVFANTLTRKKGILSLIRSWPKVLAERPDAVLHVYGKDKPDKSGRMMKEVLLNELSEAAQQTVHFHGHVTKATLDDALRRARVAVFPSYAESFGNAPVESMAMGCATIYTRRSCGPEIVRDNQDGLLVDPENIEEITGSILRLLNDHSLNARLAAAGVDRVRQQYCPTRIAARNESFYADCIREFARRNNTREVGSRLQRA